MARKLQILILAVGLLASLLPGCRRATTTACTHVGTGKRFASDEILLSGKTPQGAPFFLSLLLSRKEDQAQSNFEHYRFASLISPGVNESFYERFSSESFAEVAHDFLTRFKNNREVDLSTRETYELSLHLGVKDIHVRIKNLDGDFIVKNDIDYSKYLSVGRAEVELDDQSFEVEAVVEKIYSANYDTYIFYPDYNSVRSETRAFTLWDEQGNFYLVDTSKVETDIPNYRSHTWVLFKRASDRSSKKAFEANVVLHERDGQPSAWDIELPALGQKIHLVVTLPKASNPKEGLASGEVTDGGSVRKISGLYEHHIYNPS